MAPLSESRTPPLGLEPSRSLGARRCSPYKDMTVRGAAGRDSMPCLARLRLHTRRNGAENSSAHVDIYELRATFAQVHRDDRLPTGTVTGEEDDCFGSRRRQKLCPAHNQTIENPGMMLRLDERPSFH